MTMPPNFVPNNAKYKVWLDPDNLIIIKGWARDGLTDAQICKNLGIAVGTLYEWKKKYPEIAEALKKGKEIVDREVENALLKRALGYNYVEITQERKTLTNEFGEPYTDIVETKRVTKHVIPDVTAQIIWLKHRKPQQWQDHADGNMGDMENLQPIAELLNNPPGDPHE